MLQLYNNSQSVSYLHPNSSKRNMNVTFRLVQGLIQYPQPSEQGRTKMNYK